MLVGGIVFDRYGGAALFQLQATIVLLLMCSVLFYQHVFSPEIILNRSFKAHSTRTLEEEEEEEEKGQGQGGKLHGSVK